MSFWSYDLIVWILRSNYCWSSRIDLCIWPRPLLPEFKLYCFPFSGTTFTLDEEKVSFLVLILSCCYSAIA